MTLVSDDVPNARQMTESSEGIIFAGSGGKGKLYAVVPAVEGEAEVVIVDTSLTMPSGVALRGQDLYVAALNKVLRYRDIADTFRDDPEPEVITDVLPVDRVHDARYLAFGPDGHLYVSIGAPCEESCNRGSVDERYASILRMHPETGTTTVFARGVRASEGMDWHPETGELWFSDVGSDKLEHDTLPYNEPPDEINSVTEAGQHFGYPYFHAGNIRDRRFGRSANPYDFVAPEYAAQVLVRTLGVAFYTGDQFPADYCGALFLAENGTWDGWRKFGYGVGVLKFASHTAPTGTGAVYETFTDVWKKGVLTTGRPADVLVARDGSLLVSDGDYGERTRTGAIYRVTYNPQDPAAAPAAACSLASGVALATAGITATNAEVAEGTDLEFTVTLDKPAPKPEGVEVRVRVSETGDMLSTSGLQSVVFEAGQQSRTLTLASVNDAVVEGNGTVTAALAAGVGYEVGANSSAEVTVADDDTASFAVSFDPANVAEGEATSLNLAITNGVAFARTQNIALAYSGTASSDDHDGPASLELRAGVAGCIGDDGSG